MSRILIVGDLHLGKGVNIGKPGIGNALNSRIQDQLKLLDWVLDQAVDNNVDSIIFTGDICEDPKPDYILIELFISFLKRLEICNISVEIVAGNHDIKRTGNHYKSFLDLITAAELPSVHIHKHANTLVKHDLGITLLPFRDRRSLNCKTEDEAFEKLSNLLTYELESIPSSCDSILIGHLALKGSIFVGDEIDNLANELMCPLNIFNGYDYVWMGHVHKPQVRSKVPYIAHVGSLDISDFGETDHTKIIILYDTKSPDKFKEIEVPSRPLRQLHIDVPTGFDSTNYVIDQIKASNKKKYLNNAIVKVNVKLLDDDAKNINREIVESTIYDLGAYHISNLSESRNVSVISISNKIDIDNKIDTKIAINIWSEQSDMFDSDKERSDYIDLAKEFVDLFNIKSA